MQVIKESLKRQEEERRQAEQQAIDITKMPNSENKLDITKPVEEKPELLTITYEIIGTLADKNAIEEIFYEYGYHFHCINTNEKELIGEEEIPF